MSAKPSNILLTLDDVRNWKRERELCAARIIELDKKLAAVAAFMPEDARIEVFGSTQVPGLPKVRDDKSVVFRFVSDLLENEPRGFSVSEVEGIAKSSEVADLVAANPGVIQEALVGRARRGSIRRRGDVFYHPSHEPQEDKADKSFSDHGAAEYFREIILAAAIKREDGMPANEMVSLIRNEPRGKRKIDGNVQYPYSLIGRMTAKQLIVKSGGRYYHPSWAPSAESRRTENIDSADQASAKANGSRAEALDPSGRHNLFG